ncbi:hypothetical protein CK203_093309 [Vitis vinifera]|uniref:DUF4283 domain-containing protein n=1 Tax=Vitis vinifera TaxID=29760 RepID=A0A438E2W1_VITVI|nr:hypothetical protein CK203_093309 [Vitis vinifera]
MKCGRKGLSGGWNILAEKLRAVGVVPTGGLKNPLSIEVLKKEKELEPRTYVDVAKSKTGSWENGATPPPELDFLKYWAGHAWLLKGKLNIVVLGKGLLLFEFELLSEAERILLRGKRRVKDNVLFLEKWHRGGCFCNGANGNEAWVRVVGLPLHLWSREIVGEGGRQGFTYLRPVSGGVGVLFSPAVVGNPALRKSVGKGGATHGEVGVQGEPSCGSSSKGAIVFFSDPAVRGPGMEATDGEDRLGNRVKFRSGLGEGSYKIACEVAQLQRPVESRPIMLKGWQSGCEERPFYIKGPFVGCEGMSEMGLGHAIEGINGVRAHSLFEVAEMEARATKEASRARVRKGPFGLEETVEGVGFQAPLCAVLNDGSPWVMDSEEEKSKEGVEGEILKLLLRLKTRRDQGKKKGTLGLTRGGAKPRCGEISGVGSFECQGCSWRVVVFWDNRVLELMGMEEPFAGFGMTHGVLEKILIRFPNEGRRGGRVSSSMRRFSEVIDDLDLTDLPLQGVLFLGQCRITFPSYWIGEGERGHVPFRFENMWLKEEGFKDLLKGWWQGLSFSGSFSFILAEKLKALKAILKTWNKDVFGKVGVNKRLALDKVAFWDSQKKMRLLSMEELEARKEAKGI